LACQYTLESFVYNVKIAYDIYRSVLEKLTMNYCNLKTSLKCDYATKILKELKERGIKIEDETYQKVAKMIFKNQGVKINLNSSQSPERRNTYQNNDGYYKNNYNSYNNGNKRDSNKDQLKWQRKNNKWCL